MGTRLIATNNRHNLFIADTLPRWSGSQINLDLPIIAEVHNFKLAL